METYFWKAARSVFYVAVKAFKSPIHFADGKINPIIIFAYKEMENLIAYLIFISRKLSLHIRSFP